MVDATISRAPERATSWRPRTTAEEHARRDERRRMGRERIAYHSAKARER